MFASLVLLRIALVLHWLAFGLTFGLLLFCRFSLHLHKCHFRARKTMVFSCCTVLFSLAWGLVFENSSFLASELNFSPYRFAISIFS